MASLAISLAPDRPVVSGSSFYLWCVFAGVAPLAQTLKVIQRVIQEVAVFVVHLAAPCLAASLAWATWFEPFRGICCAGARFGPSLRIAPLR